jgi:hypothetical protein
MIEFIDLIKRKYISNSSDFRPMDLARKIAFFTMDVTTDVALGHCWGCLAKDEAVDKWLSRMSSLCRMQSWSRPSRGSHNSSPYVLLDGWSCHQIKIELALGGFGAYHHHYLRKVQVANK